MRIKLFLAVLAMGVLGGCAAAPTEPAPSLSPAQSFYAATRTYESVLRAAVDYKDGCLSRPAPLQTQCREVVQVLREVNRQAQDVILFGEVAIVEGQEPLIAQATDRLEDLRDHLRQQVLAQMAAESAAKIPEE